ncbi:MAG: polymer-forming cytoskeletal protein [Lachnospiraceae bacterium]|nr:polymer-forming cytoskeletal protein [Lachnospiraceae bacterium]
MPEPEAVAEPEAMPEPESFAEPEAAPAEEMPAEETPAEEATAEEAPAALDTDIFAGIDNELTDTAAEAEDNVDERNEQMDTFNEDIIEGLGLPELEEGPEVDENGSITAGMTINGDITSGGSLEVVGTVKGNINVRGKLNVSGSITGNSKAAEIFADSAKVIGEMISSGAVKVGQESVIIGNISATSAVIAGAVKGDIDVKGPVILDTSAIVMGDIKSKSVQINNGAVIEGHCSQCYAEVSPTSFFEDVKGAIDKKK